MKNDEYMNLSTAERRVLADQFTGPIKKKILASVALSKDEKAALNFATNLVAVSAQSWRQSGRKRIKNLAEAGRDALYLRVWRARTALEAAEAAGANRTELKRLRDEFETATADYDKYKRMAARAKKNA